MKYSEYFCLCLKKLGYTHCFTLQGGAIMHLINSADKYFTLIPFLHEHSATIAAEYFNSTENNKKAWVLVSAGPGLTNCVTAISGAFLESRELLIVGGQVKHKDIILNKPLNLRQTGLQQNDGRSIVKKITKFSKTFSKQENFYNIKKYISYSSSNRKGPVFFEIPIDIQGQQIKEKNFLKFRNKRKFKKPQEGIINRITSKKILNLIKSSKRVSILLGGGISRNSFKKIFKKIQKNDFAFFTTWNGADLLPDSFKKNFGRPNIWGQRYSNIIIQQSDLLIAVGTRLSFWETGFNYKSFLPKGKIIHVDIDKKELKKNNPKTEIKVQLDANIFLKFLSKQKKVKNSNWINYCYQVKKILPLNELSSNKTRKNYISPYTFYEKISKIIDQDANIVPCSSGGAFTTFMQTFSFKSQQICLSNKGLASMGYGLAGAIGLSLAKKNTKTILFEGDGGFTQNLQEVGTAIANNINLKIFLFNDNGYASIRLTQKNYFKGKYVGCDKRTGLVFPKWKNFFSSYKIATYDINNENFVNNPKFINLFNNKRIVAFLVNIDPEQTYFPKITSYTDKAGNIFSNPIHLMTPALKKNIANQVFKFIDNDN